MGEARTVTPASPPARPAVWWWAALSAAERAGQSAATPAWAELAEQAIALAPENGADAPVPACVSAGRAAQRLLLPPLRPFVEVAVARFRQGASKDYAVLAGLVELLGDRLTALAARTLVAELRTAREAGRLEGSDPHRRFANFLRQAGARPALRDLLTRFPLLARSLAEATTNAVDAALELAKRLAADRKALIADGLWPDAAEVTGVRFGQGDAHRGGRTVSVVTFAAGGRIVYKPRPLGLHARWNELLDWFGGLRPELAPRTVAVLPRSGYGWAEYVAPAPCRTEQDVRWFYRRLGAQLALLHLLSATDMHCENVIAEADQPVLIDVETLFHPRWHQRTDVESDPARDVVECSVLNTSILPRPVLGEHGRIDLSAFGGRPGARFPEDMPTWADGGTDAMRLIRRQPPYAGGDNRPWLAGEEIDPVRYGADLVDGFGDAYRTLATHTEELSRRIERFAAEEIRIVLRPTQTYALLLSESAEPALLTSHEHREQAFAALREETGYPHLRSLAPAETQQLLAGDVPLFTGRPDGTDIRIPGDGRRPGLLERAGLSVAAERVRQLGAPERLRQEWFIEASVATMVPFAGHRTGLSPAEPADLGVPDQEQLLGLAGDIGDELIARACGTGERVNWAGLELDGDGRWSVRQLGAALGDGYPGVALFLAELGRCGGIDRYLDAAARAVRPLTGIVRLLAAHPHLAEAVGPGAFTGLGGICYATARLATLLDDRELTALVPAALAATDIAARAAGPRADVADGLAGALMAAHAVGVETGLAEADALALRLADTLADALIGVEALAQPGFLFGRAGVRHALALVGRDGPSDEPAPSVDELSWCSGLAGLVLGGERTDVERFFGLMARRVPHSDHSLCHGELGLVEALVELRPRAGERARTIANRTLAHVVGAIGRRGFSCGTPGAVATPGLLTGLAGIGYGLLRCALGSRVPSVLLLRPTTEGAV
jgi:type 2 lantibiotic biosynthesis protein LanM